jgi:Tol biopolymer transport system component
MNIKSKSMPVGFKPAHDRSADAHSRVKSGVRLGTRGQGHPRSVFAAHLPLLTVFLLGVLTSVPALAQTGADLLQQALRKERVDGDLKGAIELYRQIIKDHAANRALAAQALVQMGKGFEKLGAADARNAYEKVLSDYADQSKEVAEAKARLKVLDGQEQPAGANGQPVIEKVMVPNSMGRPSPDGRYFSFVNWDQGNLAIYDMKTGEKRDVTIEGHWGKESSEFCDQSFWSPDGKQIAYGWFTGDKTDLRIIDRAGGKPRILVPFDKDRGVSLKDWSPDGRYIVGLAFCGTDRIAKEIVLVEVSTGAIKPVKDLPAETDAWTVTVSISPDGKHIAYDFPGFPRNTADQQVQRQVRVVDADGSNDRILIDHPANDWAPRWMPDGKHLLFVSDRSGTDGLWVVPIKQGDARGEPRLVRDGLEARFYPLGCTLDGTLYYNSIQPRRNVFVAGVDLEAATMQQPRQVSLRFDGRNHLPRWSPDGSSLAYHSRRAPGFKSFLVFRETATGKERDVEIPLDWPEPQWSPDGARMVFGAWAKARYAGLYTLDVQSGHCVLVVDKESATWGNFSRDGHHLIYLNTLGSSPERGSQIIERDLKSGHERVIRHSTNRFNKLLLSPDGLRLAYVETNALSITATGDGSTKTVWESSGGEQFPELAWLSDSRRLLVATADAEGTQQLHVVDTQTKSHRPVGKPLRGDDRIQHLTVHPDGSRIAFSRGSVTEEVWTMKNIVPEEKQPTK